MHAFAVLHVQQNTYVGGPGRGRVMRDIIIVMSLS